MEKQTKTNEVIDVDEFYRKNGYVLVRSALSSSEVDDLRAFTEGLFESPEIKGKERSLSPRHIFSHQELYMLPFKEKIVAALKGALGEQYTMIPDFHLQRNAFGSGAKGGGWHIDAGSEWGSPYLLDPQYRFVKCGLFLQDNTVEWGGGIRIVPGSHRFHVGLGKSNCVFKAQGYMNHIRTAFFAKEVDLKKGDFIAFDSRLLHASSWPNSVKNPNVQFSNCITNIPKEHSKFVFYWDSARKGCSDDFLNNSVNRASSLAKAQIDQKSDFSIFLDYLRYYYPADYPAAFVEAAKRENVQIASLSQNDTAVWRKNSPIK